MRLIFISDTHNQLSKVDLPEADLLLLSGDFTMRGKVSEYERFNADVKAIKGRYTYGVLACDGNHDFLGEEEPEKARAILTDVDHYLLHQAKEINGVKFFASPISPFFHDWAWNVHRGAPIKAKWNQIPQDTEILLTHGPAYGILDEVLWPSGEHVGCQDLLDAIIARPSIKIHSCGHIHCSRNIKEVNEKLHINASVCNEKYEPINKPVVVNYDPANKKYEVIDF